MKGVYPRSYFKAPHVAKPIEEIWDDIDAYSGEYFEDEVNLHEKIDFVIPLAPLRYKGRVLKGLFFSQGCEYLLKLYPDLKKIFFAGAYTMWSNYSWSDNADYYLTCYENKPREQYYKNKYPHKKHIPFVPLQDVDFTNEYKVAPTFNTHKTIDILCVSTPLEVKNLPMVASVIKAYEKKYNRALKATFVLGNKSIIKKENGEIDYSKIHESQRKQLDEVIKILGESIKNVEFHPWIDYKDLMKYYTGARCLILASLIEGKNRSIGEANACNTPVVVFRDHNKWARGGYPVLREKSGEYAEIFSAECMADAVHKIISHPEYYEPRKSYLKYSGRKNFINTLVDYFPYYHNYLIDFKKGGIHENLWIDLATQDNYQLSYYDFLYGKNPAIQHVRGLKAIDSLIKFFYSRFGIK